MSALATKDQDLRQALERHAGQEKHMLAEVNRARQAARALEGDLAKEQQRRVKSEEAAGKKLEAELDKPASLRDGARDADVLLRDRLAAQGVEMAQALSAETSAKQEIAALTRQIEEERRSHGETRRMLVTALERMSSRAKASSAQKRTQRALKTMTK